MICVGLDLPLGTPLSHYLKLIETLEPDFWKVNPAFCGALLPDIARALDERGARWIYDGKLGDVPHTNEEYARYVYDDLGATGVTLNPYVGLEALRPFFKYGRYNFILCRTTNQEGGVCQRLGWRQIVDFARQEGQGVVFPSMEEGLLVEVSTALHPSLILSPGIGAQGGKTLDLPNVLYSVSRSVITSEDPKRTLEDFRTLSGKPSSPPALLRKVEEAGLIKTGDFQLASGARSNQYLDLRGLSGLPDLYAEVVYLLSQRVEAGNAILGLESASIGVASSVGLLLGRPSGFVRKQKKEHGARKMVEGLSAPCKVTLIEDVVTTGGSVLKAIEACASEGYEVTQVLAICNRGFSNVPVEALIRCPYLSPLL